MSGPARNAIPKESATAHGVCPHSTGTPLWARWLADAVAPVQTQAEPVAWATIQKIDGTKLLEKAEVATNPDYIKVHREWLWVPLYAGAAPVAQAEPDAARFVYLMSDLAGSNRVVRNALLDRLAVMSYSAGCAAIDAAMKGTP